MRVKEIMTKNPINVDKNSLAVKALAIMNNKKIIAENACTVFMRWPGPVDSVGNLLWALH